MKKTVIKLALLSLFIGSIVSCREESYYHFTQKEVEKNIEVGAFSSKVLISQDGKRLLKWYDEETTELDMEKHPILRNIKVIERNAFNNKKNLTKIILPEMLEEIKSGAFSRTSLNTIVIPNSVKKIENVAFADSKLTEIQLSSNLKEIEPYAFDNNQLSSVEIPEGVEKVGRYSFQDNKSVNKITFPSTIKTIEHFVITNNPVETIIINAITPPEVNRESFAYKNFENFPGNPRNRYKVFSENLKILVPSQSVEAYKTSGNWQQYAKYIVPQENKK